MWTKWTSVNHQNDSVTVTLTLQTCKWLQSRHISHADHCGSHISHLSCYVLHCPARLHFWQLLLTQCRSGHTSSLWMSRPPLAPIYIARPRRMPSFTEAQRGTANHCSCPQMLALCRLLPMALQILCWCIVSQLLSHLHNFLLLYSAQRGDLSRSAIYLKYNTFSSAFFMK